ncbi:LTA synthase family protein [Marinicella rhabdoformis]|uniref:LTA synthase family protein n=1 Tax=Marinicella rhabdoformis TaxID=2580566 RepID=UPI001FE9C9B8|nr:LTA synthase family protein [Marinicella rhabdoformis]
MYVDRLSGFNDLSQILWGGFRIDVATLFQILTVPYLLILLSLILPRLTSFVDRFTRWWCWSFLIILVLMECATPSFLFEYNARPNRLFFEYLSSPNEVAGMLLKGYFLQMLVAVVLVISSAWLTRSWLKSHDPIHSQRSIKNTLLLLLLIPVFFVAIRSGFQHRPINPAMVAFSQDRLLNTLPLNSTYSVLYAIYQMKNEASASELYGNIDSDRMIEIIRANMTKHAVFTDKNRPTLHTQKASFPFKKKNLIIVVEESLGAQFVGSLGGLPLTPNIDKWKEKSWFFNNLYATGTRSARGLEAITTGFLPSPARAVLKLPKAQSNFYTIAQSMREAGYENSFIYGGESHFDNMKGFFLANGFDFTIDQNDYKNPEFKGNWGVSDGDLFNNAIEYLNKPSDKPKFSLIFSSSNHTPFEYPDNKIEQYDKEKHTVNNAVKYADFALGKFLDELESNDMLKDSIVLVVADHDARVMGDEMVPINRFHIPGFIISEEVGQKVDDTLVSQIDLAPTLLSLLGIETATPMIGQDLTQIEADYQGRAVMQYANNQAYMTEDHIVYLQPEKKPIQYAIKSGNIDFSQAFIPDDTALAHAQFSSWAYNNEKYRLVE